MSAAFLPADVVVCPFAPLMDTLGRSELEVAAAVMVRALATNGNTWRAVTEEEFERVMGDDPIAHAIAINPFLRPDFRSLIALGFAVPPDGFELTEKAISLLGRWVVEPQSRKEAPHAAPVKEPPSRDGAVDTQETDPGGASMAPPGVGERGLYRKFVVKRTDGSSGPGGKHEDCEYFVLDWVHDPFAVAAALAYADACAATHPELAADLRKRARLAKFCLSQEALR